MHHLIQTLSAMHPGDIGAQACLYVLVMAVVVNAVRGLR